MSNEIPKPYDLEPEDIPAAGLASGPAKSAPKGKLEAEPLMSHVGEDEDATYDPEVDRVLRGEKPAPGPPGPTPVIVAASGPILVKPGLGDAKMWGILAGVLLISAMVATGMTATNAVAARVALTLYGAVLHTATGVAALWIVAMLTGHRLGDVLLAGARMATAVAAFQLVFHTNVQLVGQTKVEETILGLVVYVLVLIGTFRLWGARLGMVAGVHFALWLAVQVGLELRGHVESKQAETPRARP